MDFLSLAKKRYSVRKYKDLPVEPEKIAQILEAGRVAPTGANRQPQRILVVQTEQGLEKLKKAARFYDAPVVMIVCTAPDEAWVRKKDGKNIAEIDASIVTDHMMLEATSLGLGSLWICWFDPDVLREEFQIPDSLVPVNLLAIGYADGEPASENRHDEQRKPLHETVSFENW